VKGLVLGFGQLVVREKEVADVDKYKRMRKNTISKTLKSLTIFRSFPSLDAVYLKDESLFFIKENKESLKSRSRVWEVKYGKNSYFTVFPSGISFEKAVKDFTDKSDHNKNGFSLFLSARPWNWAEMRELGSPHVLEKMKGGWVKETPLGKQQEIKPKTNWIKVKVFFKYLLIVEEPLRE
jgi:hypothetical protein